jgi:hypothetical protein
MPAPDHPPTFADQDEANRYWAGRHDWRNDEWEDNCGDPGCDHPCCRTSYIPWSRPRPVPSTFGHLEGLI